MYIDSYPVWTGFAEVMRPRLRRILIFVLFLASSSYLLNSHCSYNLRRFHEFTFLSVSSTKSITTTNEPRTTKKAAKKLPEGAPFDPGYLFPCFDFSMFMVALRWSLPSCLFGNNNEASPRTVSNELHFYSDRVHSEPSRGQWNEVFRTSEYSWEKFPRQIIRESWASEKWREEGDARMVFLLGTVLFSLRTRNKKVSLGVRNELEKSDPFVEAEKFQDIVQVQVSKFYSSFSKMEGCRS